MANRNQKMKFGYGNENRIQSAIDAGKFDGGDLILTKDTHRLAFVDTASIEPFFVKSQLEKFDSLDAAENYLTTARVYSGELISVKVNGKEKTYRVQSSDSGFVLEDIQNVQSKEYIQIVDEFPETSQEEGVIYISGTTGKVWTGSEYKTVFEDIQPIRDELDTKAPISNPAFTGDVTVDGEAVALQSYVQQMLAEIVSSAPGTTPLPSEGKAGQTWRVVEAGEYSGQQCEIGDLIICVEDFTADDISDDKFIIMQSNIDGAVTGAKSSQDGELVIFSGNTGKIIKESGVNIDDLKQAIENSHTHENKEILDSYSKTQDELVKEISDSFDNRLRLAEPYISGHELVANGYAVKIEKKDDETNTATYYTSGQIKTIEFPAGYSVVGGAIDDNCQSSSITMQSGSVNILQGGSDGDGSVSDVSIVINGGTIKSVVGGGYPNLQYSGKANHVGAVHIVVNDLTGKTGIFGGGYSYASVGDVQIDLYGGAYDYVTAGGSNGSVASGTVNVYDGQIDVLEGTNHGFVGNTYMNINGGSIGALYAGMEPGGEVIGTIGHAQLELIGGNVSKIAKGQNGTTEDYDNSYISGYYYSGVANDDEATVLGLSKKEKDAATPVDVETAKNEAIDEAKNYINSALTLNEF